MSEGNYVIGLEPGNLRSEGRQAARAAGELVVLAPGEQRDYDVRLTLHHGADAIAGLRARLGSP
jgi:sirohydrochlorin ferrochelatase